MMLRFPLRPKDVWLSLLIATATAAIVLVTLSALRTSGYPPSSVTGSGLVLMALIVWISMVVTLLWTWGFFLASSDQARAMGTESAATGPAMRRELERTRLILDSTLDAVVGMDRQGIVTDWNARAAVMFGWTREEVIGRQLSQIIVPPRYREEHERGLRRFFANGEGHFLRRQVEIMGMRRDGTEFSVELTISPLTLGDSCAFSAFIADITERKGVEEALRESQQRFSQSFNEAPIGMALVSIEGHWLQVNRALCQILGQSEEDLLKLTFNDITHPDDLEIGVVHGRRLLNGEIPTYQLEKRYIHKQGHTVWILLTGSVVRDAQGAPLYLIAQIQDITERKRTEEGLRESEERFRVFMDNSPAAAWIKDDQGRYTYVNKLLELTFDTRSSNWLGSTDDQIWSKDTARQLRANDAMVLATGNPVEAIESVPHLDGYLHHWWVFKFPLQDTHGAKYVAGMAVDVTDRKRAEEALRTSEHALRTLLKEREQLMQDLHDGIIQSLYAIGMSVDECRRLMDEEPRKAGMKLGQTVHDINRVIREVRHHLLQGEDDLPFSAHRLKTELARVASTMERANALHFHLKVDPRAAECLTTEERREILYIAQEAMSNCLRHSGAATANVALRLGRDRVVLEVEDDGRGFDTTALMETTGGLRNIERRSEKVGAKVEIVSRRDHGTRLRLSVPIHA